MTNESQDTGMDETDIGYHSSICGEAIVGRAVVCDAGTHGWNMEPLVIIKKENSAEAFLLQMQALGGVNRAGKTVVTNVINLRIGVTSRGGYSMTKKGISIPAKYLREIMEGLKLAEQDAVQRGWIEPEAA